MLSFSRIDLAKISQNPMYSTHIKRHHNPLESVQIVREVDDSLTEGLA